MAASASHYALQLDLNKPFGSWHVVILPLPLALDFDAALWRRFSGEARIERLQRDTALLRKYLNTYRRLFEGGCIRGLIRMRTGQDIDRSLPRQQWQKHLLPENPGGDQYLNDQRPVPARDPHPASGTDIAFLRQVLGYFEIALRGLLLDARNPVGHIAFVE